MCWALATAAQSNIAHIPTGLCKSVPMSHDSHQLQALLSASFALTRYSPTPSVDESFSSPLTSVGDSVHRHVEGMCGSVIEDETKRAGR